MTTTSTTAAGPVMLAARPGWWRQAACATRQPRGIDLAEIEDRPGQVWLSTFDEIAAGREFCMACPVRDDCLIDALRGPDVSGMVGATTPAEREDWKKRHPDQAGRPVTIYDLITASEWTVDLVAELVDDAALGPAGTLPVPVERVILAMTAAGMDAQEIADRLNGVAGRPVTVATVGYVRQLAAGSKHRRERAS